MISVCVFDVIISKERLLPTDTVKAPGGLLFSNDSTLKGNEKCSWLQTNNKVLKKKRLHWWRLCKNKRVTGRDDDDATFGH